MGSTVELIRLYELNTTKFTNTFFLFSFATSAVILYTGCSHATHESVTHESLMHYYSANDTRHVIDAVVDTGLKADRLSDFADVESAYKSQRSVSITGSHSMLPINRNLGVALYHARHINGSGDLGWVIVEFDDQANKCHSVEIFSENYNAIINLDGHGEGVSYPGKYRGANIVATPRLGSRNCISQLKIYN